MGKRKRKQGKTQRAPQASRSPAAPFNNPFGALSEVRGELPPGEPSLPPGEAESRATAPPASDASGLATCGKLVVQREKKGRAGKTVTRITGLPEARIAEIAGRLKSALGCGATREAGDLLLLGSLVDRAVQWLEREGARNVVVSGAAKAKPSRPVSAGPRSWREPTRRGDLEPGLTVDIVLKPDQRTGALTRGVIQDILTRTDTHPHGIKVRLDDGNVGRVKRIVADL